jgi:hypothetical protein
MFETLRKWSRKALPSNAQSNEDRSRQADEDSRERRAQSVATLRGDIHRIQHEIAVLNDTMTAAATDVTVAQQERMAALHRELADRQRDLSKYQARI